MHILISEAHSVCIFLLSRSIRYAYSYEQLLFCEKRYIHVVFTSL